MDAHITDVLNLELNETVLIGIGDGNLEFKIVGIAYHPLHIYMAPEGSLFPPETGQYVIGYVSDLGMERLSGEVVGSANNLILDVDGTPSFDLPNTEEYEGEEIDEIKAVVSDSMEENGLDGRIRDRGQTPEG